MRDWKDEKELAAMLLARANAGRRAVLTPDTAYFIGLKLMTVSEKPTREDIARLICPQKCTNLCYACSSTANTIVRVYGQRVSS